MKTRFTLDMLKGTNQYDYIIGIDAGVNTGIAVWNKRFNLFGSIETMPIHKAMEIIKRVNEQEKIFVRVEDARKRKWFGKAGREQLQGAGSIKRDCKIWEDFLTDLNVPFELVAPKNNSTKLTAQKFNQLTGWKGETNEHSRDAAMLVFGY